MDTHVGTVWLDIIFGPLFLSGIETIEPVPSTHGGYGAGIIHADYTHSLVGALLLSALYSIICVRCWEKRSGIVLGLVTFSHWLLDLVVHRHDMRFCPAISANSQYSDSAYGK